MLKILKAGIVALLLTALVVSPVAGAKGGNGKGKAAGLSAAAIPNFTINVFGWTNTSGSEVVYLVTPDDPTWFPNIDPSTGRADYEVRIQHQCFDAGGVGTPPGYGPSSKGVWWPGSDWNTPPTGDGNAYFFTGPFNPLSAECVAFVTDTGLVGGSTSNILVYDPTTVTPF